MKLILLLWLILTFIGPAWLYFSGKIDLNSDYATANRESAHLAPDPKTEPAAVIQVYTARAFSWRGIVASHCWISIKPKNADSYTVYQVVGWRTYRGLPALSVAKDIPDRNWFNAVPRVILDIRGEKAEKLIPKVEDAALTYPYAAPYVLWPGPNSNTFPAYIARKVPELRLSMPADAVGKDYLPHGAFFASAPSGTGYQFSLYGLFGLLVAKDEGFEVNILGLTYGIKLSPLKILLPGLGYGMNVAKSH